MTYPSIRIEGAILSPDILGRIEELPGQRPADFALDASTKVKDEIARAWADAKDYWRMFQGRLETVKKGSNATTETRNLWIVPLMGLLRYDIEYQPRGTALNGRIYVISHRATNRADAPVQIIGSRDPAGLDRKPANATRRMSAHALVQEFLNLHDQLYGLVTDGHVLRLLRDSSRLVKQSYLEFDVDRIFTDGLFADFAVLYRLLHATRLPLTNDTAATSLIEQYHQDSLDSGTRIRAGLSHAVERAILDFGNGFLSHPNNDGLRTAVVNGDLSAGDYYQQLLRLIYRLLFLMVIEERDLVFPANTPRVQRDIHRKFYSVARLRRLAEQRYLADPRRQDLWVALQACFRLFEANGPGAKLSIAPLAGDLFSATAIGSLADCTLGNDVLLGCLRSLGLYRHPDSGQLIRVNYAALNVEEFGSVYEGLLEYEPEFTGEGHELHFGFRQGDDRATTGSHYTPDDLVQPLIRHSLDHLIAERLQADDPEAALLELRVADIACGSGHILLAAARRIATELAVVRTGEEQPSPPAYRAALRDTIRRCIYGVDLNPLAVELCKVALWLEAHIPGQPLNFLDHHVKCGNAIVGFARREELGQGVPTAAFKTLPGDDKDVGTAFRKKNKEELQHQTQAALDFTPEIRGHLEAVLEAWQAFSALPEQTPAQIDTKKEHFAAFSQGEHAGLLRTIADIPVAQFYIPKMPGNEAKLVTDGGFRGYWRGRLVPQGQGADAASVLSEQRRFFHWFLEFPEIMDRGGFDCILGNPPYLGGQALSGTYGHAFCECMRWRYAPTGLSDLVVFFLRRIHGLLRDGGFTAIIITNSIVDGDNRRDGLEQIIATGAQINMAMRGIKWPGTANLVVSLLALHKGEWNGPRMLDNQPVEMINTFFEEGESLGGTQQHLGEPRQSIPGLHLSWRRVSVESRSSKPTVCFGRAQRRSHHAGHQRQGAQQRARSSSRPQHYQLPRLVTRTSTGVYAAVFDCGGEGQARSRDAEGQRRKGVLVAIPAAPHGDGVEDPRPAPLLRHRPSNQTYELLGNANGHRVSEQLLCIYHRPLGPLCRGPVHPPRGLGSQVQHESEARPAVLTIELLRHLRLPRRALADRRRRPGGTRRALPRTPQGADAVPVARADQDLQPLPRSRFVTHDGHASVEEERRHCRRRLRGAARTAPAPRPARPRRA